MQQPDTRINPMQPVTKVGAVVVRGTAGAHEFLLIQPKPKPKTPEDLPPIGFVRGTRMFTGADGIAQDASHDGRTAPPEGSVLEPVRGTLAREIEEEAGVTPAMLSRATVMDMGAQVFPSTKKVPYPIHWFVVQLDDRDAAAIDGVGIKDSLSVQWAGLSQLEALVEQGRASPGYAGVAKAALAFMGAPNNPKRVQTRLDGESPAH